MHIESVNNPFFQSVEPVSWQLQANEAAAAKRQAAPSASPKDMFKALQGAVAALGDVLDKGQNVSGALAGLASTLADFSKAAAPAGAAAGHPPDPNKNPPPAPPGKLPLEEWQLTELQNNNWWPEPYPPQWPDNTGPGGGGPT